MELSPILICLPAVIMLLLTFWVYKKAIKSEEKEKEIDVAKKETLNEMLRRENREDIFKKCMGFLPTRIDLDLCNFNGDIFAH